MRDVNRLADWTTLLPDALGGFPNGLFGDFSTPRGCVRAGSAPAMILLAQRFAHTYSPEGGLR